MALNEFKAQDRGWWNNPNHQWTGGGHTTETDPTKKGWKAFRHPTERDTVVIGRRGVKGCFTGLLLTGIIGISIYRDNTVEEVLENKAAEPKELTFIDDSPGWALEYTTQFLSRPSIMDDRDEEQENSEAY